MSALTNYMVLDYRKMGDFTVLDVYPDEDQDLKQKLRDGVPVWNIECTFKPPHIDGQRRRKADTVQVKVASTVEPKLNAGTKNPFSVLVGRQWEMNGNAGVSLTGELGSVAPAPAKSGE